MCCIRECGRLSLVLQNPVTRNRSQTYVSSIHGTATIRLRHNILSHMSELNTTEEYVLLLLQVVIYVQNLAEISGSPT